MPKSNQFRAEKAYLDKIACGRSYETQVTDIMEHGNHGTSSNLRNDILAAHGISNPKEQAEQGLIFGCYRPFTTPFLLHDYVRLLDRLGVDYTWLEKEYCCGLPLVTADLQEGQIQSSQFIRNNMEAAREKGVKALNYCCVGCAYAAKQAAGKAADLHRYILDLILDNLRNVKCETAPVDIGYFEGCHTFYRAHYPDAELDWPRYRSFLEGIPGLTLKDLPNKLCCKKSAHKIVQKALDDNLDKILCSCNGCYRTLKAAAGERLDVITYPEMLIDCF